MKNPVQPLPDSSCSSRKPRLVLAEDEPALCYFLGELLEAEYAVEFALNGEQAWDAIQQERPDVVLSDVDMPALGGLELVRRLRDSPATTTVPILLLSALVDRRVLEEGIALGANGWMQKPFRPTELLAKLRRLSPPH